MDEDKKVYYLLIFMFTIFIGAFIAFFIIKNMNIRGKVQIEKKYSTIVYELKDNELSQSNDLICVRMNNIKDELYFDIYNTGNKDVIINNTNINNISTNMDKDKLNIKLNVDKDDVIKGGEVKRVVININYEDSIKENNYLNFDIKYGFN